MKEKTRRFPFKNKKEFWFDVTDKGITFHRPYRSDRIRFLLPQEANMETFKEARAVFGWHYYHGLAHRRPHPLGISVYDLHKAHVASLHAVGQMWAKEEPFDVWLAESARMCARDGARLMANGALAMCHAAQDAAGVGERGVERILWS